MIVPNPPSPSTGDAGAVSSAGVTVLELSPVVLARRGFGSRTVTMCHHSTSVSAALINNAAERKQAMSNTPRHIDLAVEDAMQTREEAEKLIRKIDAALDDDTITPEEALAILHQAKEVLREAHEDVMATERANVAELVMASNLKDGTVGPTLLRRARDCGLSVSIPVMPVVQIEDYRQADGIA